MLEWGDGTMKWKVEGSEMKKKDVSWNFEVLNAWWRSCKNAPKEEENTQKKSGKFYLIGCKNIHKFPLSLYRQTQSGGLDGK